MSKLDKTQPYGEVSGVMECGTRYFQGDKRFDVNGDEIVVGDSEPSTPAAKDKRKAKAEPSAPAAIDDQLAAQLRAD